VQRIFIFISLTACWFPIFAQNLEKLNKDEAVKVNGGLQFNSIGYAQSGLFAPSREPFTWYASGNMTVNLIDVSLPFTFSYSNQGGKYTQPFNRAALHPHYKWIKTHIGIVSMNFSPYTVNGHLFAGGGVELTPGKWNIQLLCGRFQKAIQYNALDNNIDRIAYKRFGYGLKIGYETARYGANITLFKAKDDPASLPFTPLNTSIQPQDNLVMSVGGKAKIFTHLFATAEYALSGLTQNLLVPNELGNGQENILHQLINGNPTTAYFQAYKASLDYSFSTAKIAFKYEHIDPGYKTLGGYYFNNDLENYTLAPSFALFKKKLNVGLNTGYQINNLAADKSATTSRWVGSAAATFVPNKTWVFSGTYSNFSTFTQSRPITDPFYFTGADTLNFYQLSQNASAMINNNFGSDQIHHNLQFLYNYQVSASLTGAIENGGAFGSNINTLPVGVAAQTHMINLGYSTQFKKTGWGISLAANMNKTTIPNFETLFFGPTLQAQKKVFNKKGTLSFGSTYNRQFTEKILRSNILNHRISIGYSPKSEQKKFGQSTLSANGNFMQRFATESGDANISELNVFLNFSYGF
jgi:hypothetical protein